MSKNDGQTSVYMMESIKSIGIYVVSVQDWILESVPDASEEMLETISDIYYDELELRIGGVFPMTEVRAYDTNLEEEPGTVILAIEPVEDVNLDADDVEELKNIVNYHASEARKSTERKVTKNDE